MQAATTAFKVAAGSYSHVLYGYDCLLRREAGFLVFSVFFALLHQPFCMPTSFARAPH